MKQEKFTDPYDIGWRDGYEACKIENNLSSNKTILDNKDLREVIDKSYDAGYEEAKKLLENSIFGLISWHDGFQLNFDQEEFHNLIHEKMGLEFGDKVMITITKQ